MLGLWGGLVNRIKKASMVHELAYRLFARSSRQVLCTGHEYWWLRDAGCQRCGAIL